MRAYLESLMKYELTCSDKELNKLSGAELTYLKAHLSKKYSNWQRAETARLHFAALGINLNIIRSVKK